MVVSLKKSTFFQISENFYQPNRLTRNPLNPKDILRCSGGTALKIRLKPTIFLPDQPQHNKHSRDHRQSSENCADGLEHKEPFEVLFAFFWSSSLFLKISFSNDTDFAVFPADVVVGRV